MVHIKKQGGYACSLILGRRYKPSTQLINVMGDYLKTEALEESKANFMLFGP